MINRGNRAALRKLFLIFLVSTFVLNLLTTFRPVRAGNIRVPLDYPTIQAAINAAVTGDVITISPGTYLGNLLIVGKEITLTSLFSSTGDRQYIDNTIIAGSPTYDPNNPGLPVIRIGTDTGTEINLENTIQGLTLKNGSDGIKVFTKINILDNHITRTKDAIDLTSSGALIQRNLIDLNTDDAVDFDIASYGLVENNILRDNTGDGIEMRFHEYSGPTLNIIIRNNQIIHNNSDGIQLIRDWIGGEPVSNRVLTIEKNLIYNNRQAGLGLMDEMLTNEDYRGSSLLERIHLFNNTIINNNYGVSGGDNMVVVNNIIANSKTKGVSNVNGSSTLAYNVLWNNVTDNTGSNVDENTTLHTNPLLDANYALLAGSPALDSGTAYFEFAGSPVLDYPAGSYFGAAPDRGWMEMNILNEPTPSDTPITTPSNTPIPSPSSTSTPVSGDTFTFAPLDDATINGASPTSNYGSNVQLSVDNDPLENLLIKFQVTGVGNNEIAKATLKLYNNNDSTKGGDFYQGLNNSWTEETVNWSNAPAAGPTLIKSLGAVAVNSWVSVDLTTLITGDGIYTLRASSTSGNAAKYSSKEGAQPPVLEIVLVGETTATPPPAGNIRFAVIGDYGDDSVEEGLVADLVDSWNPDFVTTVGDNNYMDLVGGTIDDNIGQYYQQYIYPYSGSYGAGSLTNRFFPSIGNHDLETLLGQPYFTYFTLPGNERYYDFVQGPVHFFIINSDPREADGVTSNSTQAQWLQPRLEGSTAPWQIVIFHHAPYSSGTHGSSTFMRWPFADWGADAVLAGHDHTYERLSVAGLPYFVNGMGGKTHYNFVNILPESQLRYNASAGAMLVEASDTSLNFKFYSISNILIDSFNLNQPPTVTDTPIPSATTVVPSDTTTVTPSDTMEPSVTVTTPVPPDQFIYYLPIILVP